MPLLPRSGEGPSPLAARTQGKEDPSPEAPAAARPSRPKGPPLPTPRRTGMGPQRAASRLGEAFGGQRPGVNAQPGPAAQRTLGAEPRTGAGGDGKRRRGGGAEAEQADCGDAAACGAAQSLLGAELSGAVWVRGCGRVPRRSRARDRAGEPGRAESSHGAAQGQGPIRCEQPGRRVGRPDRGRRQLHSRPPPSQAQRPAPRPPAMVTHVAAARRRQDHG